MNKYLPKLSNMFSDYSKIVIYIGLFIVDIFFLRRFLDKNYVKNAYSYTGAMHSCNYLYFLVKHCGFKITHASYVKKSIKYLTEQINKEKSFKNIRQYVYPQEFIQCSDLSKFPNSFL